MAATHLVRILQSLNGLLTFGSFDRWPAAWHKQQFRGNVEKISELPRISPMSTSIMQTKGVFSLQAQL
jgi:hypothetical protein